MCHPPLVLLLVLFYGFYDDTNQAAIVSLSFKKPITGSSQFQTHREQIFLGIRKDDSSSLHQKI
jgi:hypothetical protein